MVIAGINVIDTDSMDAAADIIDEVETWITCTECNGNATINDYSPSHGIINIVCPACEGYGVVLDTDGDDLDPEPPTPAAPVVLPVQPVRLPLWASMAASANGRVGADSRQSRDDRRRRRRELDRAA